MIPGKFIKNITAPMLTNSDHDSGIDNESLTIDGNNEYLELHDFSKLFASELNADMTWEAHHSSASWGIVLWIKKTAARNSNTDQQTLWHNGGAGHHTMELYFDDNSQRLKYKIGNGSATQITVDTGIDVVLNEWTFIYWRKRVKSIICEVKNLSGQSEISRYGAYNSEDEWTKIQAWKDATHPLVSYAGCYKEGVSGSPAEFFAGEFGEIILLRQIASTNLTSDDWYNGGDYLDVSNFFNSTGEASITNIPLWIRPGHGSWWGLSDGFADKIIFDLLDWWHTGNQYANAWTMTGSYTTTNGWATDGSSSFADREGDGQSAAGLLTYNSQVPVAEYPYLIFFRGTTTNSSGTNTITLGGATFYSANENATYTHDFTYSAGCFVGITSNTNKLVVSAHNTTDWSIDALNIIQSKRCAVMHNLTASTDITRTGRKVEGSGGGGSGAR